MTDALLGKSPWLQATLQPGARVHIVVSGGCKASRRAELSAAPPGGVPIVAGRDKVGRSVGQQPRARDRFPSSALTGVALIGRDQAAGVDWRFQRVAHSASCSICRRPCGVALGKCLLSDCRDPFSATPAFSVSSLWAAEAAKISARARRLTRLSRGT